MCSDQTESVCRKRSQCRRGTRSGEIFHMADVETLTKVVSGSNGARKTSLERA